MTLPTIHSNGTAKSDLIEELCEASGALNTAIRRMQEAYPNGRDYYPQGPEALGKAVAEHSDRIQRVRAVHQEIGELIEAIDRIPDWRRR